MPVYEKGRKGPGGEKVWRIVVWSHGKSHDTTRTGGTKREWEAYERRWKIDLDAQGAPSPQAQGASGRATLFDFSRGEYATHAKAHLARSTWSIRRFKLAALCSVLGDVRLDRISTSDVERYKAARVGQGKAAETINGELAALSAVLTYARDLGLPTGSPKFRHLPKRGKGRVKFWTTEQIHALYAACERESPALLGLVVCLANTGMRPGEALAFQKTWIDLGRGMITIQPNDAWKPKDGEAREVTIADALRPWLLAALKDEGRYVFPSRTGDRWACFPKRAFARAVQKAGLADEGEGPYKLRHSYAAHALAAGADLYLLGQLLGHESERTTRIYAHLLPQHLEKARGLVNLSPATGPAKLEARKRWRTG